jgi:hypothetical protein
LCKWKNRYYEEVPILVITKKHMKKEKDNKKSKTTTKREFSKEELAALKLIARNSRSIEEAQATLR